MTQMIRKKNKSKTSKIVATHIALAMMAFGFMELLADARTYVWTYEYLTMPQGAAEVEYYLTTKVRDTSMREISSWQHQLEIEYGITPHWDVALYQIWQDDRSAETASFGYKGFKLRTRYRVAEQNVLPLDVLVYAEYKRPSDLKMSNIGELKLILAKTIGDINASYNQVVEWPLPRTDETEHKFAAGLACKVSQALRAGIEATGNYTKGKYAVGPTLSLRENNIFLSFGAVFGLSNKADDLECRMILGLGL